ncbi:MAG: hypothetical protein ACRELY_00720 [Polyangiaceae bacterium]
MRPFRIVAAAAFAVSASACSLVLGIRDVPPATVISNEGGDGLADAYVIPKGDGPPCRFDDDAARFDNTCTFAP